MFVGGEGFEPSYFGVYNYNMSTNYQLKDLSQPSISQWAELFKNDKLHRHMPLASKSVDDVWIGKWIESKKSISTITPFEIYSIWNKDEFCGWAGIQPDGDCYEMAIVLKPNFWGLGRILANDLIQKYRDSNVDKQLFIYLPLSRNVEIVADRFKFTLFGEIEIDGVNFAKLLINVGGEGFAL